ncbi:putative PEP-CTERM system TPR-repeat lipoprotein [Thalassovita gelatinovora]|uniref:Putative PEP-CTERM system TPR-repeat lipoprotein n=1 Tax=Thalassovita gelatinovora TaxID=53501 RepID=A0A0P1F719_THAGE|nr:tetratricopeptide repeat protein [Thalassovita gelatinovora]QIZ82252.1 tetratricopeptide repeat protein [Thalassovita gelatinovora]CUH63784.1 putative PEP-CTERM system TPR-repeat lipoprotein [Thalassovita gelatinovora]SEQ97700.1 TPR repeat-containing protein [Thalassovita gelatinovora]
MSAVSTNPKLIVAAIAAIVTFSLPLRAQETPSSPVSDLLQQLEQADPTDAKRIDREIKLEWDKSGSAAMDLLLKRGREAMERGDLQIAADHLTALTDHAPGFAEGWHQRASAWFRLGRYGLALSDLEQVLTLNPNHYEALFGMAVILEQLDRPELAYRAYTLVQQIYPHYVEAETALKRLETRVQGQTL